MESSSKTYKYSPLGWAIWLYGPMFVLGGVVVFGILISSILHSAANSGSAEGGFGAVVNVVVHFGCLSRCMSIDYFLGAVLMFGFPAFGLLLVVLGLLMMNSDRSTVVSSGSITMHRGAFISWGRRTVARADIADVTIDSVPIVMVFGSRATIVGTRWNVGVVLRADEEKKPKRIVVALCSSEQLAQQVQSEIKSLLG